MRLLALIISIGIAVLPKLAQAQTDCGMPSTGEDHWPVAAPESGVFIVPSLDLVVVVNAGLYSSRLQSSVPMTILNQYVLRAIAFRQ